MYSYPRSWFTTTLHSAFLLFAGSVLFINNAYGQEITPFSCGSEGILTQSGEFPDPSDLLLVNMTSGNVETVTTLSTHVNAIGYNIQDNFIYGVDRDNGGIIRFGSSGVLETVAGSSVINNNTPVTGDVDDNGHLWLHASGANQWIQVDLNNGNPSQIDSGTPGGLNLNDYSQIVDWTFIPGTNKLYSVTPVSDNSTVHLLSFDRTTKNFEFVADLGDLGESNINFGATYADSDGVLYAGNNGSGVIWRIDIENGTASPFTEGETTSQNDGARCFDAPIEVEIELTVGPCWRMLSSPVAGLTYADMLNDYVWTQGIDGANYEGGDPNILIWPEGQPGNDESGWVAPASLNDEIPVGTGFMISIYDDDNFDGTADGFPKVIPISGPAHPRDSSPAAMNTVSDGWTLTGNPYTQSVSFSDLETSDLTDVAYIWDQSSGDWVTTNTDQYGDIPDGIITAGQAFFVQNISSPSNPAIVFNDESRTIGGQFYGKENTQHLLRNYVRFEVHGENKSNSLWIRFSPEGSENIIRGDALKLEPLTNDYLLMAAQKSDTELLDIAHFSITDENIEIPVHINSTNEGNYTITATNLDIPAGMDLYLYDQYNDQSVLINSQFEYSFSLDQQSKIQPDIDGAPVCSASPKKASLLSEGRFLVTNYIVGGSENELPGELSLQQNYPNPFNPSTLISYNLPNQSDVHLEVFDMSGRRVATLVEGTVQAGSHTVSFDASHLSSGVYVYKLQADGQILTRKLTLVK